MHTLSAIDLRNKFVCGEYNAVAIVHHFLERIHHYDPAIGAFLAVFSDKALACAKKLDRKRAAGQPLGKLAAIPVAIKDNIHVKGEFTTCASKFLAGYRAPFDAAVVRILEEADAIIIGKTNMDEFAMGTSTEYSAFQRTVNPWNFDYSPGGSSGGSAAAVAARLAPIALGSDTGGSIRQPAAFCGVNGFKPTYGGISPYGLMALTPSLEQIGPLATCCADIALVMEVLGFPNSLHQKPEQYCAQSNSQMKGLKIGVPWQFLADLSNEARHNFEHSLIILQTLGAECIEIDLNLLKYAMAIYSIIASTEAAINLMRFDTFHDKHHSENVTSLENINEFLKKEKFGEEVRRRLILGLFFLSDGPQAEHYNKAQKGRKWIIESFKKAFTCCHLIATPSAPFPAFKLGTINDPLQMSSADMYTAGVNLAGLPAISIPCGFSCDGLPLGLQLIGPQMQDTNVLSAAHAFEAVTPYHALVPILDGISLLA